MAIGNVNLSNYYTIASDAGFNLANDQFVFGIVWRKSDASGSGFATMFNINYANNASVNFQAREESHSTAYKRKKIEAQIVDVDGTTVNLQPVSATSVGIGDSTWRFGVLQRTATDIELWQCDLDGSAELIAISSTPAAFTTVPFSTGGGATSKDIYFGSILATTNAWDGDLAEFFQIQGASMTQTQIESWAAGNDITSTTVKNPAFTPTIYIAFDDAQGSQETDESGNGYHAVKTGSPTDVTHPYTASASLIMRPASDVSNAGGWLTSTGTTAGLWSELGESSPDDSNYIESTTAPSSTVCVIALSNGQDPSGNLGILKVRARLKP